MEDIHGIRPPVEVGFDPNILITIGWILGAILVFLLIFYFIKKWIKNRKKPGGSKIIQPLIPPFEAAMKKIDLLKAKIQNLLLHINEIPFSSHNGEINP